MLQKFNITTYAVALCLFGFMIFSAAPVFANDEAQGEFQDCKDMKWKDGPQEKKDCFKELAKNVTKEIWIVGRRARVEVQRMSHLARSFVT